ncbi:MAG: EscU/YscU/HrcU family type III secretion system export apparatus switch protein [Fibrobacterota bacterium]
MKKQKPERKEDSRRGAISLRYNEGKQRAPKVTAKGRGRVADEIIRIAKENGVPVREDPDLLEILYPLELDAEIPPELYSVVAELLAYIYRMNQKASTP